MLRVAETSYVKTSYVACDMLRSVASVAAVDRRWLLLLSRLLVAATAAGGRAVAGCC